jgi:hypothetical protein
MLQNLDHAFPSMLDSPNVRSKYGFQLMVDELKLETRMRWDARTNNILGICREHSKEYSLQFQSMAQAIALQDGLQNDKVHLATEVNHTGIKCCNNYSQCIRQLSLQSVSSQMTLTCMVLGRLSSLALASEKMYFLKSISLKVHARLCLRRPLTLLGVCIALRQMEIHDGAKQL